MQDRICKSCGNKFVQYESLEAAKQCPTCLGIRQRRDSIPVRRNVIVNIPSLEIGFVPGVWTMVRHRREDFPSYKIEIAGKNLQGSTEQARGKIVLRSRFPYKSRSVVKARVMEAVHANRRSGIFTKRRYLVLDDRTASSDTTALMSYFIVNEKEMTITNNSIWSAKAYSGDPSGPCEVVAILAILDKNHQISIEDGDTKMTFP
jgi:hypothetical protein